MDILATITLNENYAPTAIVDTGFDDFDNWAASYGSISGQNSSHIDIDSALFHSKSTARAYNDVGSDVTSVNGSTFRVTVDVTTDQDIIVKAVPYLDGFPLGSSTFSAEVNVATGTDTIDLDFASGGFTFDRIEIRGRRDDSTAFTMTLENVSITATDDGDFDSGDRILIYWDGSDFVVKREDNPGGVLTTVTDGPVLGELAPEQVTGLVSTEGGYFSSFKYCDGLNLVKFKFNFSFPSFPYITQFTSKNNIECVAASGIVCDCRFSATPVITAATNKYSSDGSVTLAATSSHTSSGGVRFSNGYGPGTEAGEYQNLTRTENLFGIFTGLPTGYYKFYAVDEYNCYSVIDVFIPAGLTYETKYQIQYDDIQTGTQSVIEVLERGYGGDAIDVKAGDDPIVISAENPDLNNKFVVIRPTFAVLTLISEQHFQFIGLFSQDDRKYKLSYTHGSSSWVGFVAPSVYTETYSPAKNYYVSVTFTDNLKTLEDIDFKDASGNIFTGLIDLREVLLTCLAKTGLDLNVVIAVNRWATGMNTSNDPLGQTDIDAEAFLDDDGNPLKCSEVLEMILKPFGAFVKQRNGKWHIIEEDSQTSSYNYREYTYNNTYVGSGTINPLVDISTPNAELTSVIFANPNPRLTIIPAYGKITIFHALKVKKSIFPRSLDKWQVNGNSGGYGSPYDTGQANLKGVNLYPNNSSGLVYLVSPFFDIKADADALNISFRYQVSMTRYSTTFTIPGSSTVVNGGMVPDPPWVKLSWRLIIVEGSNTYYYNERSGGWHKSASIATSTSSIAIPTTHPTSKTFTIQTGLSFPNTIVKVQHDATHYFYGVITAYNPSTGSMTVDSISNVGTGTYSGASAWTIYNAGDAYITNDIFIRQYGEMLSFEKRVEMFPFLSKDISIQLQLISRGSSYKDFADTTALKALQAATLPINYEVVGTDPDDSNYLRWYKLKEGTDAESSPTIFRPDDFNSVSNAVVWDNGDYGTAYRYVQPSYLSIQEVEVRYLPGGFEAASKETLTLTSNPNVREPLEYELNAGDLPPSANLRHEIYSNIFLFDDEEAYGWARAGFSESQSIQSILLKNLGNQYAQPSWRLSGDWLGPDLSPISILRHTITASAFAVVSPGTFSSPWTQIGSGQTWTGTTEASVAFSPINTGNSLKMVQSNTDLVAGSRIRVDFSLVRTDSDGTRIDRFMMVLLYQGNVIQLVTLVDNIQSDNEYEKSVSFNIDAAADQFGFFIENQSGSGTCNYAVDYFDGEGIASRRFYELSRFNRNDRSNLYRAEISQVIPAVKSADVTIDDTGGGNTDSTPGSGGSAGRAFSSGFSSGFN